MGETAFIQAKQLLNATVSGTTVATSTFLDVRTMHMLAAYIAWTGTLNATFSLQASPDGTTFFDTGTFIKPATGSPDNFAVGVPDMCFNFFRVQVTPTSGSGNVTITASAKRG